MPTNKTIVFLLRCALLFVFSLVAAEVFGQTTYYSRNGATPPRNWDEADSWTLSADGSGAAAAVPGRSDNVVVLSGHDIIVDAVNDNGSAGVSPDGLGLSNVGTFTNSGVSCFYQTGNIVVKTGGTLTSTARFMFSGSTHIRGTFTSSEDVVNVGRLEVAELSTFTLNDDLILTGFSETLLYNTTNSDDDIYIDHTDALLCGDGAMNIGVNSPNTPEIQYFNSATIAQICDDLTVTCGPGPNCSGFPQTGTGTFTLSTENPFVKAGATWRYLDDGTDQGTAWQGTSFDDSGWSSGAAQLGYGDGDETTTVGFGPDPNNKYITTYFRTSFFVEDVTAYSSMLLRLLRDDGGVVYVNGTEVDRQNMPGGAITYTTTASSAIGGGDEDTFFETNLSTATLVNGTNYIAVEIHQANITSSDISFDLELLGNPGDDLISPGDTWRYLDDGTDQGTAWQAIGFDDSGWSSGGAQLGYGDGDETTTVGFGPDPNNKYTTTYFRHSFNVTDPTVYSSLTVELLRDDGGVVYVNGTEVARQNMPGGAITYTTFASGAIGGADEDTYFPATASSSLLVAGTNVVAVEIHQANLTSSDISFDLRLVGVKTNPLPVELVHFDAAAAQGRVLVHWATASEVNNDYFTVERSAEAEIWEAVGHVGGLVNSDMGKEYSLVDPMPLPGTSYYRLKQTDLDGSMSYSHIVAVTNHETTKASVFPNPASSLVTVRSKQLEGSLLEMVNATGSKVPFVVTKKNRREAELNVGNLPRGIYLLHVLTPDGLEIHRLVLK